MRSAVVNILVGLWIMSCFAAAAHNGPYVPAMFLLGDSLEDAGNNNYIPNCTFRANFTPYGVSFFRNPTGRFTNGRTAFDFLATYLGLPFTPPYLEPKANFSRGINFASAGSGLLNSTGAELNIMPMSSQLIQFKHFSSNLKKTHPSGAEQAKSYIGKSLYCISIGGNDIVSYITNTTLQNSTTPQQFVKLLLSKFDQYIAGLYHGGARYFFVLDVLPVGCLPRFKYIGYSIAKGGCWEIANQLAMAYNTGVKALVTHLNKKLDGATLIELNTYNYLINIIEHGEAYGFRDTKSACCGSGMFNAEVGCGKTIPQSLFCNDLSAHVYWDNSHLTEKVYAMLSHQIWSGNSSVMYPFNLSTLVMGGNAYGLVN